MKYRKLLTAVIFLINGYILPGQAEAGCAGTFCWSGFSSLRGEGTFTGLGKEGSAEADIIVVNAPVYVRCYNIQNGQIDTKPGVGNMGGTVLSGFGVPAMDGSGKTTISIEAPMSRYDDVNDPDFINICNASDPNKFPRLGTAYVPFFETNNYVYKCNNSDPSCTKKLLKYSASQNCVWQGSVDSETGLILDHNTPFTCQTNQN
jgi:hypothetical protein